MSWMLDEYIRLTGRYEKGTFTGKPVNFGGSLGRTEATGYGVTYITREALQKMNKDIRQTKIAVQGFGNVGSYAVKGLEQLGAKILSVCEMDEEHGIYAIYAEEGLSYQKMKEYKEKHHTLFGMEGVTMISQDEFWKLDVDVVCPCALENAIDEKVASDIKAALVVEGANGPITPEANRILEEKNIEVIPDILANSGGVMVSYFEWVQNLTASQWTEKEVLDREEKEMTLAFHEIWAMKEKYDISCREAAYLYSVEKVTNVMKLRGII